MKHISNCSSDAFFIIDQGCQFIEDLFLVPLKPGTGPAYRTILIDKIELYLMLVDHGADIIDAQAKICLQSLKSIRYPEAATVLIQSQLPVFTVILQPERNIIERVICKCSHPDLLV